MSVPPRSVTPSVLDRRSHERVDSLAASSTVRSGEPSTHSLPSSIEQSGGLPTADRHSVTSRGSATRSPTTVHDTLFLDFEFWTFAWDAQTGPSGQALREEYENALPLGNFEGARSRNATTASPGTSWPTMLDHFEHDVHLEDSEGSHAQNTAMSSADGAKIEPWHDEKYSQLSLVVKSAAAVRQMKILNALQLHEGTSGILLPSIDTNPRSSLRESLTRLPGAVRLTTDGYAKICPNPLIDRKAGRARLIALWDAWQEKRESASDDSKDDWTLLNQARDKGGFHDCVIMPTNQELLEELDTLEEPLDRRARPATYEESLGLV